MSPAPIPESVYTVDCHYMEPLRAAAYLLVEDGRAAFVDNNTAHAVPRLMAALDATGLSPEQVDYAIITHVHLDHAGGSPALMDRCPNATLLAHPKAARHIIDPSRLVAGAKVVYGDEAFAKLYGEIRGVDASRVRSMDDGEVLDWGSRKLHFFNVLGHASHHVCIHDSATNGLFTGDALGLGQSSLLREGPPFVACSTPPPDFDPTEARISAEKIREIGADWAYLPHFGFFPEVSGCCDTLLHSIDLMESVLEEAVAADVPGEALHEFCIPKVHAAMVEHLQWCGVLDLEADLRWFDMDIGLNAMGIAHLASKRRKAK